MSSIIFTNNVKNLSSCEVTIFTMGGNNIQELSDYVRRILSEKGLTTQDVEDRSRRKGNKIDRSYITKIINGTAKNLSVQKVKALSLGLGVNEDEVFAIARGKKPQDSEEFQKGRFAAMALKFSGLTSSKRISAEQLIEILDRELDRLADS